MSTKAIREALDWLENYLGNEPEAQEARRAARAEVEAIERAAKSISDNSDAAWTREGRDEFHRSIVLMESIAEQEKAH